MQTAQPHVIRKSTQNRSKVTNGTILLTGVDGRSPMGRRFRDLVKGYQAEIGVELTSVEHDLIRQAATLVLRAEGMAADVINGKPVDTDQLIRLTSTAKRILTAIAAKAAKRKPPAPTLADHIAKRTAQRDNTAAG